MLKVRSKKEVYKNLELTISKLAEDKDLYFFKAYGYEADQLIAFLAEKYCDTKAICIFSGDKEIIEFHGRS